MLESTNVWLLAEIAALKAELTALRSATVTVPALQLPDNSLRYFDFLRLPRELRDQVHQLCLVVGKVWMYRGHHLSSLDMRIDANLHSQRRPEYQAPEARAPIETGVQAI